MYYGSTGFVAQTPNAVMTLPTMATYANGLWNITVSFEKPWATNNTLDYTLKDAMAVPVIYSRGAIWSG